MNVHLSSNQLSDAEIAVHGPALEPETVTLGVSAVWKLRAGSIKFIGRIAAVLCLGATAACPIVARADGVAVLFIVAVGFSIASLIGLARETRIAVHEFDHHQ